MTPTRRTPASDARLEGRGLFTDQPAAVTIRPAETGAGLLVARPGDDPILAHVSTLSSDAPHPAFQRLAPRCTALNLDSGPLFTVEHALSALVGLGVTDALIEADGPELPILDGSALPYVHALLGAGLTDTDQPAHPLIVTEELTLADDRGGSVRVEPADDTAYTYHLDYGPAAPVPPARVSWDATPDDYAANIAPARTYALQSEAEQMQALGLFRHLTPRDMLVIAPPTPDHPGGPIDNAYRFPDEPARHKLLDLIGDLALVGRPIRARITARRSGHALHHQVARALVARFGHTG
ncbi:MAG: UDP-3-O-acyl-N-acetylglucosamine deacetylase [Phycisphaerales bacterium JB040]